MYLPIQFDTVEILINEEIVKSNGIVFSYYYCSYKYLPIQADTLEIFI